MFSLSLHIIAYFAKTKKKSLFSLRKIGTAVQRGRINERLEKHLAGQSEKGLQFNSNNRTINQIKSLQLVYLRFADFISFLHTVSSPWWCLCGCSSVGFSIGTAVDLSVEWVNVVIVVGEMFTSYSKFREKKINELKFGKKWRFGHSIHLDLYAFSKRSCFAETIQNNLKICNISGPANPAVILGNNELLF